MTRIIYAGGFIISTIVAVSVDIRIKIIDFTLWDILKTCLNYELYKYDWTPRSVIVTVIKNYKNTTDKNLPMYVFIWLDLEYKRARLCVLCWMLY